MDVTFYIGILGSFLLLIGAAYPLEKTKKPVFSVKNRFFAIGSLIMLLYAIAWYLTWGSVFFIYLELLIILACFLMMFDTNDTIDTWIISAAGVVLLVRSLSLFQWRSMLLFIVAFVILGLGYTYDMHTVRRYIGLTLGGALIALSSYLDASRIFFRLNIFFALFSLIYMFRVIYKNRNIRHK